MKRQIQLHCRRCRTCARHNIMAQEFNKEHFAVPTQPMEFIAMDLIGEFHPASSKGNRYALTAICMLTGFTFCIPLKNKTAEEVVKAYLNHICCVFVHLRRYSQTTALSSRTRCGKMCTSYSERNTGSHQFTHLSATAELKDSTGSLKPTVGKQIQKGLEWDDLVWKATSAYISSPWNLQEFHHFFSCLDVKLLQNICY